MVKKHPPRGECQIELLKNQLIECFRILRNQLNAMFSDDYFIGVSEPTYSREVYSRFTKDHAFFQY